MNISGIRINAGFYDYNTIKSNEVAAQQLMNVNQEQESEVKEEVTASPIERSGSDFGAYDFAKMYQPDATYELKGVDSDIVSLDVEKALSDMKKDQILQQYQFFVGESQSGYGLLEMRNNQNFSL